MVKDGECNIVEDWKRLSWWCDEQSVLSKCVSDELYKPFEFVNVFNVDFAELKESVKKEISELVRSEIKEELRRKVLDQLRKSEDVTDFVL